MTLTGTGASPVALVSPNLDFGSLPVGTASPSIRSTAIVNQDPNNVLLSVTAGGPNAADFTLVSGPTVGQPLTATPPSFRFSFTPSVAGAESATYTLNTSDGPLTITLTGTGPSNSSTTPMSLNHSSISFGNVRAGTAVAPLSVALWNFDPNAQLLGVSSNSPLAADFPLLSPNPLPLNQPIPVASSPASASLSFQFGFNASTTSAESATYTIQTSDGNLTVTLSGTGTSAATASPVVLASPNLDFGSITVGTTGPSIRTTAILNQDPNNVLLSVTPAGPNAADFTLVSGPTVGQPLPTTPVSFRFTFTSTVVGSESATYTLDTTDGPLTVALTGIGTSQFGLASPNLDFGSVAVGTASRSIRSTAILNPDPNNLLLSVTPGGPNAADFTLVSSPAIGQPLTTTPTSLRFSFTPTVAGVESATYTIATSEGSETVTVTGTGTSPVALGSPNLDFGSVAIATTGPSIRSTALLNQDPNNVLLSVTPSGPNAADFTLVSSALVGQPLPTSPVSFRFSFTPTVVGPESATYTLDTTDGALTVSLTGTGTSQFALVSPNLDFGPVIVGTASPSIRATAISNQDPNNVLLSVTPGGPNVADFTLVSGPAVGQPLPTNPATTFRFSFTPTVVGPESATYTIATSDGSETVTVTGTGVPSGTTISPESLNHSAVSFGTAQVGPWTGLVYAVSLWNLDPNAVLLGLTSDSPLAADFQPVNPSLPLNQPIPVSPNPTTSSLKFQWTFFPSTIGTESATYTIQTSDGNLTVDLSGTGTAPLSLNHSAVSFGHVPVGTAAAAPLGVSLWNFDPNAQLLGVTSNSPLAADFPLLSPNPLPLNQPISVAASPTQQSFTLQFGFNPSTVGAESATYTIETSDGNLIVTLSGAGTSSLSLNHSAVSFGNVQVGTNAAPLAAALWNFDPNAQLLGVTSNSPLAADFPLLNPEPANQPIPVAASPTQQSLTLQFGFNPSTLGAESATYIVQTSEGDLTVTLSGAGITAPPTLSHSSMSFGNVVVGTTASPLSVGLWNLDPKNQLLGVTSSSPLAADFPLLSPGITIGCICLIRECSSG